MTYERDDRVRVRFGGGHAWISARVLLDLGGETVIVGRDEPKTVKRAQRADVRPEREPKAPPATATRVPTVPRVADLTALYCIPGDNGDCALQRQASPPTNKEMIEGAVTICGRWLSTRSAPTKKEPGCPLCRFRLGLGEPSA